VRIVEEMVEIWPNEVCEKNSLREKIKRAQREDKKVIKVVEELKRTEMKLLKNKE